MKKMLILDVGIIPLFCVISNAVHNSAVCLPRYFCYLFSMKRAFAIIIVVLLAIGMIATLIPNFN